MSDFKSQPLFGNVPVKILAFDADDTLWDTQLYFDAVEHKLCDILSAYGNEEKMRAEIYKTETGNMATLGFGADAFTISLVETAIRVSGGNISAARIEEIITEGKKLLSLPATPLPGVVDTLTSLRNCGKYTMVLYTKGNPLDQENKLKRSGLSDFFDIVDIVSNKTVKEYGELCKSLNVKPSEFAMIGNSMKSDILPIIELGGYGIHIPYHITWQLETAEDCESPRLIKLQTFEEIRRILI